MASRARHSFAVAVLFAPIAGLLVLVGQATGWQNFYTLDDPYIHLAHAALLADGHYGVNPGELAAASSSVLWPFLLAPFEWLDQLTLAPLFLNVVCCGLSLWIIYILFARFFGVSALFSGLLAGALGFSLNLYGLIFTGMEHSLQVLLAVVVANGLVVRRFKHFFWISITLLPLVRYE